METRNDRKKVKPVKPVKPVKSSITFGVILTTFGMFSIIAGCAFIFTGIGALVGIELLTIGLMTAPLGTNILFNRDTQINQEPNGLRGALRLSLGAVGMIGSALAIAGGIAACVTGFGVLPGICLILGGVTGFLISFVVFRRGVSEISKANKAVDNVAAGVEKVVVMEAQGPKVRKELDITARKEISNNNAANPAATVMTSGMGMYPEILSNGSAPSIDPVRPDEGYKREY